MRLNSPCFVPVDSQLDWLSVESKYLRFWKDKKVLERNLEISKGSSETFSFIDGPVTANNPMGVHTGRGRTLKDIFQRYHLMKGCQLRLQNGFDTQGLWVEVEVEKALGLHSKHDILEYGLEAFAEECKARVLKYSAIITRQSQELGQQMDWENSYYTHHDSNIQHIWHFLKVCYNNNWLYKSELVMPWCPRCSTSLSSHEMADSYKTLTHPSVYLKLPVES